METKNINVLDENSAIWYDKNFDAGEITIYINKENNDIKNLINNIKEYCKYVGETEKINNLIIEIEDKNLSSKDTTEIYNNFYNNLFEFNDMTQLDTIKIKNEKYNQEYIINSDEIGPIIHTDAIRISYKDSYIQSEDYIRDIKYASSIKDAFDFISNMYHHNNIQIDKYSNTKEINDLYNLLSKIEIIEKVDNEYIIGKGMYDLSYTLDKDEDILDLIKNLNNLPKYYIEAINTINLYKYNQFEQLDKSIDLYKNIYDNLKEFKNFVNLDQIWVDNKYSLNYHQIAPVLHNNSIRICNGFDAYIPYLNYIPKDHSINYVKTIEDAINFNYKIKNNDTLNFDIIGDVPVNKKDFIKLEQTIYNEITDNFRNEIKDAIKRSEGIPENIYNVINDNLKETLKDVIERSGGVYPKIPNVGSPIETLFNERYFGLYAMGFNNFTCFTKDEFYNMDNEIIEAKDVNFSEETNPIGIDIELTMGYEYFNPNVEYHKDFNEKYLKETIELPDDITVLNSGLFSNCAKLKEVKLPENLKIIENRVFKNCISLNEATIPDGVEKIGEDAFYNCSSLEKIAIPSSVKEIGNNAFAECHSLKEVIIPKDTKLEFIDSTTFENCENLTIINKSDLDLSHLQECNPSLKIINANELINDYQSIIQDNNETLDDILDKVSNDEQEEINNIQEKDNDIEL